MFPANEPTPLLDFVVHRLRTAGWISGQRFEKGRGYVLAWNDAGRQRVLLLQELVKRHRLDEGGRARTFTSLVLEKPSDSVWQGEVPTQVEGDFWVTCLKELEIGNEATALAAFAEIVATWQLQEIAERSCH